MNIKSKIENLLKILLENMHERRKVILALSCLVVFVTTYTLILPAFTLEKDEAVEQGGIDLPAAEEIATSETPSEAADDVSEVKTEEKAEETAAAAEAKEEQKEEKKADSKPEKEEKKTAKEEISSDNPLLFQDKDFSVSVTDKHKELSDSTRVEVNEISADDKKQAKQYKELYSDALKAVREEDGQFKVADFEFAKFYDISLVDGQDTVETKKGVAVTISYEEALRKELKVVDPDKVRIIHFAEDKKTGEITPEVLDSKDFDVIVDKKQMKETSFEAEGFSVYAVVYTVDFEYDVDGGKYEYSMEGGSTVDLADVLKSLKVVTDDKDTELDEVKAFIQDIKAVKFSDPELVEVVKNVKEEKVEGYTSEGTPDEEKIIEVTTWALKSLKPFKTNETLTIAMNNGDKIVIKVKDEQITKEVLTADGKAYDVTVTYGENAKIPEGATLKVTEFDQNSDDYVNARKAVLADKQAKGETVDLDTFGLAALDISILDKDGNEIEPAAEVKVDIKIKSLPGVDDIKTVEDTLKIQHHVETEDGVIVDEVYNGNADAKFDMQPNETVKENKADATVDPKAFDEKVYRKEIEETKDEKTENKEDVATTKSFKTPSFSTFSVTWRNGIVMSEKQTTVHYGYMENGTFHEFSQQPSPAQQSSPRTYLITDFEGYSYSGASYYSTEAATNPTTKTKIVPELFYNDELGAAYSWNYATGMHWDGWVGRYVPDDARSVGNNSHIYVVYNKDPEPTVGGTPHVDELVDPPSRPKILKNSVENGDGTNTLSLSIIGDTKESKVSKLADVIVVFDVSGSMNEDMAGNETSDSSKQRLTIAKKAVSEVADTLLGPNTQYGAVPRIRMALVPFSTIVQEDKVVHLTGDVNEFKSGVNSNQLVASGATNWEDALAYANSMAVESDRATFIIFVTDGNPTVRITRGNLTNADLDSSEESGATGINYGELYADYGVFGSGFTDTHSRNYNAALDVAKEITKTETNKNYYSIAISNDADKLAGFTQAAGGKGNYIATTATQLNQAFEDIVEKMSGMFGWGDVQMTDGITDLTKTVEKSGLANVDEGTFRYWRAPAPTNWKTMSDEERKAYEENLTATNGWTEWVPGDDGKLDDGERGKANPAVFEDGAVKWNLGTNYMLEKDVIYRVTFDCWPKQEAFDILANLNNGRVKYSDLPSDVREQIVKNGDTYYVKTNTDDAFTTYKTAVKQGEYIGTTGDDHDQLDFQDVDPMPINSQKLGVLKEWAHGINSGHQASAVKFHLLVDGKYYMNNGSLAVALTDENRDDAYVIEVGDNNDWHYDDIYIAPGIVRHGKVLETGHTYALEEFEAEGDNNFDFSYEFKTQYVRPMNVDASAQSSDTVKYLVQVDEDNPGTGAQHTWIKDSGSNTQAGAYATSDNGGTEYYISTGTSKGVLQATNHKTSELDITKMIVRGEGAEDKTEAQLDQETFMYRVTLEVPKGGNINGITGYVYFKYPDGPNAPFALYGYTTPDDATAFASDVARFDIGPMFRSWNTTNAVIKNTLLTVRDDGTQVIQMDIPQSRNEVIRFTNLPTGTTYTIQEVYANKTKPAARNNSIEGTAPSSDPSNLADQGYTVTQIASKNSEQADSDGTTVTNTDTVTGTIAEPDRRYYNQFTNTLGKHADVKFDVTKHLDGYAWTGESYYFKLAAGDNTAGVTTPMPLTGRNPIYVTDASGTADKKYGFDKIRFVKAGTYHYTITEVDEGGNSLAGQVIDGIRYDSVKNVTVTVREAENKLVAEVTGDSTTAETKPGLVTSNTTMTNACGAVKVKKIDANKLSTIEGAVFEIRDGSEKLYIKDSTDMIMTASDVREAIDVDASVSLDSDEAKAKMAQAGIIASFTIGEQDLKGLTYNKVYTLHEISPPEGYITAVNDSTFKISINDQGQTTVELTGDNATQTTEGNTIVISISNEPGAELPHAGGIGTTLFYILGSILVLGCTVFLAARKRIQNF